MLNQLLLLNTLDHLHFIINFYNWATILILKDHQKIGFEWELDQLELELVKVIILVDLDPTFGPTLFLNLLHGPCFHHLGMEWEEDEGQEWVVFKVSVFVVVVAIVLESIKLIAVAAFIVFIPSHPAVALI